MKINWKKIAEWAVENLPTIVGLFRKKKTE